MTCGKSNENNDSASQNKCTLKGFLSIFLVSLVSGTIVKSSFRHHLKQFLRTQSMLQAVEHTGRQTLFEGLACEFGIVDNSLSSLLKSKGCSNNSQGAGLVTCKPATFTLRTEYWKSQARKYCEFCKCWFADNKVSISFHENGKRHKESVKKHISQLSKKSAKEFKQKEKIDDDMKKMESAAMAAYLKDVQNNADITSQAINNMLTESGSSVAPSVSGNSDSKANIKLPVLWQEVKNEDGSSYFWNTLTNATTWDPPNEYLSVVDQEKNKLKNSKEEKKKEKEKKQKQKEAQEEAKAYVAREQMKELSVKKEQPTVTSGISFGPMPRAAKPYGSWQPIVNEPEETVDLQLPKPEKVVPPPPVVMEPETIQFKEKRIESLGEGPVEFKKRKFNNPKRNMRQKIDDD